MQSRESKSSLIQKYKSIFWKPACHSGVTSGYYSITKTCKMFTEGFIEEESDTNLLYKYTLVVA